MNDERCDATLRRYALQCRRSASWLVDGRPMCGQHANAASMTPGVVIEPLIPPGRPTP